MKNLLNTFKKRLSFKKPLDSILYIVALLIIVYFFYKYVLTNLNVENFGNNGNIENDRRKKVVYFFMNGCPHCVSFSPIWDEFKQTSPLPTYKIESNEAGTMINKYNISGFPTILLLDENNNKLKELEGDRTLAGLNALIN